MIELLYIIFDYIKSIGPLFLYFFIMFIMIRAFVGNMDCKQPTIDNKINNIDDKIGNINICNRKHNSLIYTKVPIMHI